MERYLTWVDVKLYVHFVVLKVRSAGMKCESLLVHSTILLMIVSSHETSFIRDVVGVGDATCEEKQ